MHGIQIKKGGKFNSYGTNKNVIIKGGYIKNEGKINMKETELENNYGFINRPTGKAKIEDVETNAPILNEGLFIGKRIKIFIKNHYRILEIISLILGVIGIIITIYFETKK
jgi:hypothetical protein